MPEENRGLLLGRGEFDWQAGANSPIVHRVLKEDTHWKDISIPNEIQVENIGELDTYDTLMCVSFNGTTDAIEYIMMLQLRQGLIPTWKVNWLKDNGYFVNGALNFSERFTAIMGKTTSQGAYLFNVANGMRNHGLIPQKMFTMADNFNDNIDAKFVTQEMKDLGRKFIELFPINFEWVEAKDTREYMMYSPLGCFGKYGNMEGNEPIDPKNGGNHSMLQVEETDEYREIDDSYWQQFKKYKKSALDGFMAFYVDPSDNSMFNAIEFVKSHDKFQVRNKQNGAYGVIYNGTPMAITAERAGLYLIDRDARGLLGKGAELTVYLTGEEFDKLDWSKKF